MSLRRVSMLLTMVVMCGGLRRLATRPSLQAGQRSLCVMNGDSAMTQPTVRELFRNAVQCFRAKHVPEPDDSARHLLCAAAELGTRLSDFHVAQSLRPTAAQCQRFHDFCRQRLERRPVQYIIGNWDFYGLTFTCQQPVLIPRPETEELVERITQNKALQGMRRPRVLDVGAGTGAIGVAIAAILAADVVAIDLSEAAVRLANQNARALVNASRSSYHCLCSSFSDFRQDPRRDATCFDVIVSNPPYIPSEQMLGLERELSFEDRRALDGGDDGLCLIRELILYAPQLLCPHGTRELWLEVDESHPAMLQAMREAGDPLFSAVKDIAMYTDLAGRPRFVCVHYDEAKVVAQSHGARINELID